MKDNQVNAIEIRNLSKSFHGLHAVDNLSMTVPVGAIYGFIGENGSGKSTTEKLICGHLVPDHGSIKLFGKDYQDAGVRVRVGALIENAGCFPNASIYANLKMQALNLGLPNLHDEIMRVLKIVRMENQSKLPFKKCSLGMKQRVGIAMALLGNPALLILDEPINGLDTDGMRIMREILIDITHNYHCTVLISSHILGELEKIATHYGIIRHGHMIQELSAAEMDTRSQVLVNVQTNDNVHAVKLLKEKYADVRLTDETIQVFDENNPEKIVEYLLSHGCKIHAVQKHKVGLEEYYIELMSQQEDQ